MFLAEVVGTVVAPVKIELYEGEKLLLVRPLTPAGEPTGAARVAADRAQAGVGDRVLVVDEGNSGRQLFDAPQGAVKTVIVGVVDYVDVEGRLVYDHRASMSAMDTGEIFVNVDVNIELLAARHGWSDEEARLRKAICEIGALCYQKTFIVGADGNISARMSDDTILITPAGAMKGFLSPEHLAHVDMQGRVIDDGPRCSTETGIHLISYQERPDMKAVLHCHPPHAVALTVAGIDLQTPVIPEIIVTIGGIPTAPFGTPGTPELPESIREIVRCSDTVIMKNHGSVTLGTNLLDAFKKLDMLEHTARILWLAHAVGHVQPLSEEQVRKLLETRQQLGVTTKNTLENRCGM